MTGSRAGLGAVPRAPSARQRTVHPEPRKGGSNWAMSPCSKYRSPPEVELSNIWLALQLANNEPNNKESEQAKFTYIMTVKQQLRTHVLKFFLKTGGSPELLVAGILRALQLVWRNAFPSQAGGHKDINDIKRQKALSDIIAQTDWLLLLSTL